MQRLFRALTGTIFLIFSTIAVGQVYQVDSGPGSMEIKQEISVEQQRTAWVKTVITRLERQLKEKRPIYTFGNISEEVVKFANAATLNTSTELSNIKIAIVDARQSLSFTRNTLDVLADLPITKKVAPNGNGAVGDIHSRANQEELLRDLLKVQEDSMSTLSKAKELLELRLERLRKWSSGVQSLFEQKKLYLKKKVLNQHIAKLQEQQKLWLKQMLSLTHRLNGISNTAHSENLRSEIQFKIYLLQEQVALSRLRVVLSRMEERFDTQKSLDVALISMSELYDIKAKASSLHGRLTKLMSVIDNKLNGFKKRGEAKQVKRLEAFKALEKNYRDNLKRITELEVNVSTYLKQIRGRLEQKISVRADFPDFFSPVWVKTASEFISIPALLLEKLNIVRLEFLVSVETLPASSQTNMLLMGGLLLSLWYLMRRYIFQTLVALKEIDHPFTKQLLYLTLSIVRRNMVVLLGIFVLVLADRYLPGELGLWSDMLGIYFIYRVILILVQYALGKDISRVFSGPEFRETIMGQVPASGEGQSESEREEEKRKARAKRKLYTSLFSVFTATLVVAECIIISSHLSISFTLLNVFYMALMLAMLGISYVFFSHWNSFPEIIGSVFPVDRSYIKRAVTLVIRILPAALFINAMIGFTGYLSLAMVCLNAELVFLSVLIVTLLARGLLRDLLNQISKVVIAASSSGWIWSRAIVGPAHKIMGLGLIFFSAWFLIDMFDLQTNEYLVAKFQLIMYSPIFDLGSRPISLFLLLEMTVYFLFLKWVAKWSREFCFRLGFKNTSDVGLRHSLSVFSQYGTVLLTFLVGLKLFGFDLQGVGVVLAAISAAFAAGIGFGLRDLIGNVISGILLLVERPLRKGDLVSLGTHKGRVIETGVRSLRIRTADHLEIIVPNSDVFTKAFVNWTHQDNLLQTKILLKLHRVDDPKPVSDMVLEILKKAPGIQEKPVPRVYLKDVDEQLHLQAFYYVDMDEVNSLQVRSDILMEVLKAFKQNNVHSPYPEYGVQILENSTDRDSSAI